MSNPKYKFQGTPGPWIKRVTKKNHIVAVIPKRYGERVVETVLNVGHIYEDDCCVESCCQTEAHFNARLIAASPELYKACRALIEAQTPEDIEEAKLLATEALNLTLIP